MSLHSAFLPEQGYCNWNAVTNYYTSLKPINFHNFQFRIRSVFAIIKSLSIVFPSILTSWSNFTANMAKARTWFAAIASKIAFIRTYSSIFTKYWPAALTCWAQSEGWRYSISIPSFGTKGKFFFHSTIYLVSSGLCYKAFTLLIFFSLIFSLNWRNGIVFHWILCTWCNRDSVLLHIALILAYSRQKFQPKTNRIEKFSVVNGITHSYFYWSLISILLLGFAFLPFPTYFLLVE